ncbi:Mrp/NBP35 family ATP-binding protein [Blastochloris sulfoviridis]|uniref:Iron-sulfur cluster carrier protein n=1 Tax=Blastochloris sulfoviridis TaxID=50712 RepID=A0A5M6HVW6_9HYPH|nr:Mrp/NBP35 family ATP-binding protein [Blastochloris sulfoviridis]KAA5599875.1 Mrp/NBP35 family ATP-binding protein [Blastochloris sulfoviridis]
MSVAADRVRAALAAIRTPDGRPLTEAGVLSDIVVTDGKVAFSLTVAAPQVKAWELVRQAAEVAAKAVPGVADAFVALTAERAPGHERAASAPAPRPAAAPGIRSQGIPNVSHIIAVASGKGGVGKSTTAANLALGLQSLGLKVGVLDADIYGPSMPKLLGIHGRPDMASGRMLRPLDGFGLKVMSIGFLVEEDTPMIWRGPMVMSAITQMLREVEWGTLDVLVVDMPPGTGDAQLTIAQQVPLAGAVIVSTPQDLALIDARRGIAMFKRVDVPCLGIVENMSYFLCPNCGTRSDIFGHGGARAEAGRLDVPFLGEVPLHMAIRETSDSGRPLMASEPQGPHAGIYRAIAEQVWGQLSAGAVGQPAPRIVIEA